MRTIIAGSRYFDDYEILCEVIRESGIRVTTLISGGSPGADITAERWADLTRTPKQVYPANWNKDGKAAGPIRNSKMAAVAQAAIVICMNDSKGSHDMIEKAKAKKLLVYVQYVKKDVTGRWIKLNVYKNY
jgi:hypothetical protein